MSVKVYMDRLKLIDKVDNAWKKALPELTGEILDDMNQYIKWDTGTMAQSAYLHSEFERGLIRWQTPYVRRQYYEIKTAIPDMNARATWKWAEVAKAELREKWQRQAKALMRMYGDE